MRVSKKPNTDPNCETSERKEATRDSGEGQPIAQDPASWEGVLEFEVGVRLRAPAGHQLDMSEQGEAAAHVIERLLRSTDFRGEAEIVGVRFTKARPNRSRREDDD